MTKLSRLIAAASLIGAAALAPASASADGRHGRDEERREPSDLRAPAALPGHRLAGPELPPPPPPAWGPHADLRWDGRGWVRAGWERREREARLLEARELRRELRELELERAAFHARFAFRPGRLARFDADWAERHERVERRLLFLTAVAWR